MSGRGGGSFSGRLRRCASGVGAAGVAVGVQGRPWIMASRLDHPAGVLVGEGADTPRTASRIVSVKAAGWETITACEEPTVPTVAPPVRPSTADRRARWRCPARPPAPSTAGRAGGPGTGKAGQRARGQGALLERHQPDLFLRQVGNEDVGEVRCRDVKVGAGRVVEGPLDRGPGAEHTSRKAGRVEHAADALALVEDVRRREDEHDDVVRPAGRLADDRSPYEWPTRTTGPSMLFSTART